MLREIQYFELEPREEVEGGAGDVSKLSSKQVATETASEEWGFKRETPPEVTQVKGAQSGT